MIGNSTQRRESLDWYYLVEHLGKVGGAVPRLEAAEACLWQGNVAGAIAQFKDWQHERVSTFVAYFTKPRHRMVNDADGQAEGISSGSGAVESPVKPFGQRMKLAGVPWQRDKVSQVLN